MDQAGHLPVPETTMMRIVAPFGFYGSGNIGDESTLQGFAQLLAESGTRASVSVASRNPTHTARVEPRFRYFNSSSRDPRRWLAKLRAAAHAIVGGTPIMDIEGEWPLCELTPLVRSIDRWKVPIAFIGVGTETLRLAKSRRIVAEEIAPRVRHWSVRCDRDRQRLVEYGVSPDVITVGADMAWLIGAATPECGRDYLQRWGVDPRQALIGVNLVNENSVFDQQLQMVDALAAALDELLAHMDARVIFLANEVREGSAFDKAAAIKVIGRMKRADCAVLVPNQYFAPRQMMSLISCCDLTVSMRYHFCLFSALQGVPFIAILRSDKLSDLCWDIDWPASIVPPQFDAAEIIEHGRGLAQNATAVGGILRRSTQKMRERALRNVVALHALRNQQPIAIGERPMVAR
jgi:polysaccharide pyruvyl transferase WcaK-like protein